jgi:hypothetical protein
MGTRALVSFVDPVNKAQTVNIYVHFDGYPTNVLLMIEKATALAWPLPRYEAAEFSAAFVAANKNWAGNIRIDSVKSATQVRKNFVDLSYHYVVQLDVSGVLFIKVNHELPADPMWAECEWAEEASGTLAGLITHYGAVNSN